MAARIQLLETGQDRAAAALEEQQRLMRQLTAALQQVTAEGFAARTGAASGQAELAAKLEGAMQRLQVVVVVGGGEGRMGRPGRGGVQGAL